MAYMSEQEICNRVRPILVSGIGRHSPVSTNIRFSNSADTSLLISILLHARPSYIVSHSKKRMSAALIAACRPWFSQWLGTTQRHCSGYSHDLTTRRGRQPCVDRQSRAKRQCQTLRTCARKHLHMQMLTD